MNVVEWLRANKLTINMFFVLTKKNGNCDNQVNISRVSLCRVYSTRFLGGVIIDRYLKWTDHLNHVQSRSLRELGFYAKLERSYCHLRLSLCMIGRVSLSRVYSTRFLCVIIDRYLKWTDQLNHVQSRSLRELGFYAKLERSYCHLRFSLCMIH